MKTLLTSGPLGGSAVTPSGAARRRAGGLADPLRSSLQDPLQRKAQGGPVVQRLLRVRKKKNDEGEFYTPENAVGFYNLYASRMAQDTSALVEGDAGGKSGLDKVLKATEVDGSNAMEALISSIIDSSSWMDIQNENTLRSLAQAIEDELGFGPDSDNNETDAQFVTENGSSAFEVVKDWITGKVEGVGQADTVGGVVVACSKLPIEWHEDLAEIVYNHTAQTYYGNNVKPYVPPYLELIKDINGDEIEEFSFVTKYGAAKARWGAEFNVEKPSDKKDYYDGKAVMHTHHPNGASQANYAHTKPYDKRKARGYGWTVVTTSKVTGVADSNKTWNNL